MWDLNPKKSLVGRDGGAREEGKVTEGLRWVRCPGGPEGEVARADRREGTATGCYFVPVV